MGLRIRLPLACLQFVRRRITCFQTMAGCQKWNCPKWNISCVSRLTSAWRFKRKLPAKPQLHRRDDRLWADASCSAGFSHLRCTANTQCTHMCTSTSSPIMSAWVHATHSIPGHPEEHGKASPVWMAGVTEQDPFGRGQLRGVTREKARPPSKAPKIQIQHCPSHWILENGVLISRRTEWGLASEGHPPKCLHPRAPGLRESCKKSGPHAAWSAKLLTPANP